VTSSGKTTLGRLLFEDLINNGIKNIKFLDGENLRKRLDHNFGHSLADRFEVLNGIIKTVKEELERRRIVIVSTVSHKRKMRDLARNELVNFFEVNLLCNPNVCAERDYKNLYNRIDKNSNECFPGITEPYELSENAELIINTGKFSIDESKIILYKKSLEFIRGI
jgi:adenylylsulfate kinase